MDGRWEEVWRAPITKPQDKRVYRFEMFGRTKGEPGRFFRWRVDLEAMVLDGILKDEEKARYAEGIYKDMEKMLDTFLDARCECQPGVYGGLGEHCKFHRELLGEGEYDTT